MLWIEDDLRQLNAKRRFHPLRVHEARPVVRSDLGQDHRPVGVCHRADAAAFWHAPPSGSDRLQMRSVHEMRAQSPTWAATPTRRVPSNARLPTSRLLDETRVRSATGEREAGLINITGGCCGTTPRKFEHRDAPPREATPARPEPIAPHLGLEASATRESRSSTSASAPTSGRPRAAGDGAAHAAYTSRATRSRTGPAHRRQMDERKSRLRGGDDDVPQPDRGRA